MQKGLLPTLGLMAALASSAFSYPFKVGEVLDYDVLYLRFLQGKARLVIVEQTTYQGAKAYHMTQHVDVGSFFSNHVEITCRASDLMPLLITTRMKRKGKEALGRQVYVPEKRSATFSLTEGGKTKFSTFKRRHPIQDVVTVLYYLRTQNLADGASFPVSLMEGEYTLTLAGKENLKAGVRGIPDPVECWVVKSVPSKIKVWLTLDERHLPVRVEVSGKGNPKLFLKAVK